MNEFYDFIKLHLISKPDYWYEDFKPSFSRKGKKMLKKLGERLKLDPMNVSYNRAGLACSGDLLLMGMRRNIGIYVSINLDGIKPDVLYRTITGMKDYTGGGNNYFPLEHFANEDKIYKILNSYLGGK